MKKAITLLFLMCLLIMAVSPFASANGPVPSKSFYVYIENAPDGSYGLDFLLPKDRLDEDGFFSNNSELLNDMGLAPDCELAILDADGYVSYLAHYANAKFNGCLEDEYGKLLSAAFADEYNNGGFHYLAYSLPDLKLALFDANGAILAISDHFRIETGRVEFFMGSLDYDAATGEVIPDIQISQYTVILLILLLLVICGLTVGIEVLVGLCFKLKPIYKVALVTGVSNLVMNILLLFCCYLTSQPLPYLPCVIVGEVAAIAAEFIVYLRVYEKTEGTRLLAFSLLANLISASVIFVLFNGILK